MNKISKIIIVVLSIIIITLICIVLALLNKNNNDKNYNEEIKIEDIKQAVGIYHSYNWNKGEATLKLNKDMTCSYPSGRGTCTWTISDKNITMTLTHYDMKSDNQDNVMLLSGFKSEEECLNYFDNYKTYDYINPRCEKKEGTHEATLVNNGVLLYDNLFSKIG